MSPLKTSLEEVRQRDRALAEHREIDIKDRRIDRVFRGTFYFPLGSRVFCVGGTHRVKIGETHTASLDLSAGVGVKGVQISAGLTVSVTHTFEEAHQFNTTDCDTAQLLMRYSDSEAYLLRRRFKLSRMRWSAATTVLVPNIGPDLCADKWENDPECRCDSDREPRGTSLDMGSCKQSCSCFATLRTVDFGPGDRLAEGESVDTAQVCREALDVLNEALLSLGTLDDYVAGVVGVDGSVNWIAGARPAGDPDRLTLLSTSADAALMGHVIWEVGNASMPVLAVGPALAAADAEVRVTARHPGAEEDYEVFSGRAEVQVGKVTTVWSEVDISELPDGATGQIEVRVLDQERETLGVPLVESYVVEAAPLSVSLSA
jgi:hypothetical protein